MESNVTTNRRPEKIAPTRVERVPGKTWQYYVEVDFQIAHKGNVLQGCAVIARCAYPEELTPETLVCFEDDSGVVQVDHWRLDMLSPLLILHWRKEL